MVARVRRVEACVCAWRHVQLPFGMSFLGIGHGRPLSMSVWLILSGEGYWESRIERRDCRYITSSIGYWGKGSAVG